MCSAFLWSGSPNITSRAKIAWEEVCCPREEGCLRIRRVKDVSTMFMLKLIWRLFSNTASLWVSWVRRYLLRDAVLWDVKDTWLGSWAWRKLLRIRNIAKSFVRWDIGDGNTVRFWTDLWHPSGRLIDIAGESGTQKMGIGRDRRISDLLAGGAWRFRRCRDQHLQSMIHDVIGFPITLSSGHDTVLWKRGDDEFGNKFSASETWHQIRSSRSRVHWSKIVWFSEGVLRYAFITWLAIRDRLLTGHRTSQWGQPQRCLYCGEPDETRDHLFFAHHKKTLLIPTDLPTDTKVVGNLFCIDPDPDWDTTVERLQNGTYDRLTFILLRLVFQDSVYFIWIERNDRKHSNRAKSVEQLAKLIDKVVWNRLSSTHYFLKPKLKGIMCRWFEAHSHHE
ncbi:uncharacterized protein LOC111213492 [Brassica napus]|uniref:uncharacterized protein LOC111213492 n=1 Tax=Brassica napus TaxID=3708 RepID=UPI002079F791|nr:uncharacterized protein LOC111213492 [Brassica napus]